MSKISPETSFLEKSLTRRAACVSAFASTVAAFLKTPSQYRHCAHDA